MDRNARIAALIANSGGRYQDADKTWLAHVPEARLTALETATPEPPKQPEPPKAPEPPADPPKQPAPTDTSVHAPKTAEEYLATLPTSVAEPIRQGMRMAEARKAASIKALKDSGRNKFTDAQLQAKTQDELDMLMDLAGVATAPQAIDFSGRQPQQPTAASEHDEVIPKAPSWHGAIRAAAGASKS